MVRVHFGPPLLRTWMVAGELDGWVLKGTRKPALRNSPVDCFNRRGFSAEKRVHFGPPLLLNAKCRMQNAKLRDWLKQFKRLSCFIESLGKEAQRCTLKTEHCELLMQLWEGNSKGKLLIKRVKDTILAKNFFLSLHNSTRETRNGLFY